jgi:hypothetical protein
MKIPNGEPLRGGGLRQQGRSLASRCLLNAHSPHLLCAVHPGGVTTETCPDFRPDPKPVEAGGLMR